MTDMRGIEIQVGDVVVSGQRRGSGSGFMTIRRVQSIEPDGLQLVGKIVTKVSSGSNLLVLPTYYSDAIGK